jgi:hypothetical protein
VPQAINRPAADYTNAGAGKQSKLTAIIARDASSADEPRRHEGTKNSRRKDEKNCPQMTQMDADKS